MLKELRHSAGLTQKELAQLSGVSIRIIQHYEQGFRDIEKAEAITIYQLARSLGCSMEQVIGKETIHA